MGREPSLEGIVESLLNLTDWLYANTFPFSSQLPGGAYIPLQWIGSGDEPGSNRGKPVTAYHPGIPVYPHVETFNVLRANERRKENKTHENISGTVFPLSLPSLEDPGKNLKYGVIALPRQPFTHSREVEHTVEDPRPYLLVFPLDRGAEYPFSLRVYPGRRIGKRRMCTPSCHEDNVGLSTREYLESLLWAPTPEDALLEGRMRIRARIGERSGEGQDVYFSVIHDKMPRGFEHLIFSTHVVSGAPLRNIRGEWLRMPST